MNALTIDTDFGRELAALAKTETGGLKNNAASRSDIFWVNPFSIAVEDGWNGRDMRDPDNQAHVEELSRSIASVGVLEPLTVYMHDGKPTLTNGHCRLMAVYAAINAGAEIKAIPVKTEPRGANERDRVLSQITRNSGKQFTPLEQGVVFKRLMALGWNENEIAAKTGKNVALVQRYIDLQAAPDSVLNLVASGQVSATLAIQTLQEHGDTAGAKVLTEAASSAALAGKRKATDSTVTEVVTGAKPARKTSAKEAPPTTPMVMIFYSVVKALGDLLTHFPEYDADENPALDRAYRNAVNILAQAEGEA